MDNDTGIPATLVCWACGKQKPILMSCEPQFAFEVAGAANDVGWIGSLDLEHSRALIFCSDRCRESQRTKTGAFRARPKKVVQEGTSDLIP